VFGWITIVVLFLGTFFARKNKVVFFGTLSSAFWMTADVIWSFDENNTKVWTAGSMIWIPNLFFALAGVSYVAAVFIAGENREALAGAFGRVRNARRGRPSTIAA
jgi:hypothetical protein